MPWPRGRPPLSGGEQQFLQDIPDVVGDAARIDTFDPRHRNRRHHDHRAAGALGVAVAFDANQVLSVTCQKACCALPDSGPIERSATPLFARDV